VLLPLQPLPLAGRRLRAIAPCAGLLALLGAGASTALPDYWGRQVYRVEECDARVRAEGDSIETWSCY